MKRRTHPGSHDPADMYRRQLAAWLQEWHIDRALRSDSLASSAPPRTQTWDLVYPSSRADDALRAGQIRLLFPSAVGSPAERPLYVLLMEEQSDNSFLIAPFSRFSSPAVPGEWRTGLRACPLRVLCVWNARVVPAAILRRGWRAGVMRPDRLRRALSVYQHARHGTPLDGIPSAEIGPPLRHPLDPRHAYIAEETALLDEHILATGSAAGSTTDAKTSSSLTYEQSHSSLRLAAERPPPYGRPPRKRRQKKD